MKTDMETGSQVWFWIGSQTKKFIPSFVMKDIGRITGGIRLRAVDENCINMNLLTLMSGWLYYGCVREWSCFEEMYTEISENHMLANGSGYIYSVCVCIYIYTYTNMIKRENNMIKHLEIWGKSILELTVPFFGKIFCKPEIILK